MTGTLMTNVAMTRMMTWPSIPKRVLRFTMILQQSCLFNFGFARPKLEFRVEGEETRTVPIG